MAQLKQFLGDAVWHCEPPTWELKDDALTLTTGKDTDFWQDTYYGFRRDDGHFLGATFDGDFSAEVTFEANYHTLYDQAGLMMRSDARNWLKTGIEYSDGVTNFSTVVTRGGASDWSVVSLPDGSGPQRVRLTRVGSSVITHHLNDTGQWNLMRLANFSDTFSVTVGPTACSPQRSGLEVRFFDLEVSAPTDNPLHANE